MNYDPTIIAIEQNFLRFKILTSFNSEFAFDMHYIEILFEHVDLCAKIVGCLFISSYLWLSFFSVGQ